MSGVLASGGADASDAASARARLLVLDLKSDVVDVATARTITNLVTLELSRDQNLDVITMSDVARLAELEGSKQAMGCDAGSCLAELAGAMGARYVVTGDIGKLASTVIVNLTLFDASKATAIERTAAQGSLDELATRLPGAVQELTQPLRRAMAGTEVSVPTSNDVVAPDQPAPSSVAVPTAPSTPAPSSDGWRAPTAWTAGIIGAVLLTGAGAFDALSSSSNDAVLTWQDAVGPACVVVGVGLVATAVVVAIAGDTRSAPSTPSTPSAPSTTSTVAGSPR